MSTVNIYQIFYDEASRQALDSGFMPLDNSVNERSDWSEYWVIRQFLKTQVLDENALYGFFSPKFKEKTSLDSTQVFDFIEKNKNSETQVYTFSPFWGLLAYYTNVFEQGEVWHKGLTEISQAFFHRANILVDLQTLIMHSQNSVFCNYFVATPKFWRRWLEVGEALFQMAEQADNPFGQQLSGATEHAGQHTYPLKVFIQERIVSVLLATESWNTSAYIRFDPVYFDYFAHDLVVCDALKQSFLQTGEKTYIDAYYHVRTQIKTRYSDDLRL